MAATSLKLPDDLKQRIDRIASSRGQSPHAFMVEALTREAERSELRTRFAADADEAEREAVASGKAHSLEATFEYLVKRVRGEKPRRPRARSWQRS